MKQLKRQHILFLLIAISAGGAIFKHLKNVPANQDAKFEKLQTTTEWEKRLGDLKSEKIRSENPYLQAEEKSQVNPESSKEILATIHDLSETIARTTEDDVRLVETLSRPETINYISNALHDTSLFSPSKFTERLSVLDALYEGLKSTNSISRAAYINLATVLLSEQTPISLVKAVELRKQYFGDRVEMALMISKIEPDLGKEIERQVLINSPTNKIYFERARSLGQVYEVAL